ncbi:hypothetical protein WA026_012801 [Henosepilachna vigintioctopunctata]|uniref:Uncharacterized protein n=1 Tax=Henosepilachna vigintioctopunctata TaxID=420089 RepID=A0AAW1TW87_9CUCU
MIVRDDRSEISIFDNIVLPMSQTWHKRDENSEIVNNIAMEAENTFGINTQYSIPDVNIVDKKQECSNANNKQSKIKILSNVILLPMSGVDQTEQNLEVLPTIAMKTPNFSQEKEQPNFWLSHDIQDLDDRDDLVELKENQTTDISTPLIIIPPREAYQGLQSDALHNIVVEDPFTISLGSFPKITENCGILSAEHDESIEPEELTTHLPEICAVDLKTKSLQNNSNKHIHILEEEVEKTKVKHYKDKKTFCPYCDLNVSHFSRHLSTYHSGELKVQEIHSMKPNSKQRRNAIIALAKEGNFLFNKTSTILRPVRRVERYDDSSNEDYLPCSYCLGSYKKKSLHRHAKRCNQNNSSDSARKMPRIDGQATLLRGSIIHDVLLKEKLFPRMRADEVALVVKKDKLICSYGLSYLKGRRSKGNIDFVRQTMRRLARLLMFARSENNCIKELLDLLFPKHFDLIIRGVKKLDDIIMTQKTSSLLHWHLAYVHYLQIENSEDKRKEVKTLRKLFESQWADEISAQAGADLSSQKWNKKELLPLTSDLKILNEYLNEKAQISSDCLQVCEKNITAYKTLKEVLYCQIILLNRRRPAEVAQIKTNSFQLLHTNELSNEFENCLTQTERILLNSFSRLVIRGKRGRGVAILLSPTMKGHFEELLKVRHHFVSNNNDYIFHTSGFTCLDGTKILRKYAMNCKLQFPNNITATRLRKHLATVTQLLQFSEQDLEQLSTFMGHTIKNPLQFL